MGFICYLLCIFESNFLSDKNQANLCGSVCMFAYVCVCVHACV